MRERKSNLAALAYLALFLPCPAVAKCRTRVIVYKIAQKDIESQERAQAAGHQPWRSDPKLVAEAALMKLAPTLDPNAVDRIAIRVLRKSEIRAVFLFEPRALKKSYRITVQRLRWRDPATGTWRWTVFWATKVAVRDCSRASQGR